MGLLSLHRTTLFKTKILPLRRIEEASSSRVALFERNFKLSPLHIFSFITHMLYGCKALALGLYSSHMHLKPFPDKKNWDSPCDIVTYHLGIKLPHRLLVSSADILCKKFGPRSGPTDCCV